MSKFTSFALVGAGELGNSIIDAFKAKPNISLVVLTRSLSSKSSISLSSTFKLEQVDFEDVSAVATVLKKHNVEVVISTVGTFGLESQKKMGDAAKEAGTVKLFVPSDFGVRTLAGSDLPKEQVAAHLKSIGIPTLRIFTGPWTSWAPWLASLDINGKVHIVGKGETTFSLTDITDIGGFVAHVLTALQPSELQNQIFRIEGDRLSLVQLAALYKTDVQQLDLAKEPKDDYDAFKRHLLQWIEDGWDSEAEIKEGGGAGGSGNKYWPGHQWKTLKQELGL